MDTICEESLSQLAIDIDLYYEGLVSLYWHQLTASLLSSTSISHQHAEDIIQEAFVRAYVALDQYSLEQLRTLKARTWLCKITWDVFCTYAQKQQFTSQIAPDVTEAFLHLADASSTPSELLPIERE